MVRGLTKAVPLSGCVDYRLALLRTFTSIYSLRWHATRQSLRALEPFVEKQVRSIYSTQWTSKEERTQYPDKSVENFDCGGKKDITYLNVEAPPSIPWYLNVDRTLKPSQFLSERQRIPELPDSPPDLLQPLLQHISVDLGLDDLSLLDLRELDPPPALGSNLLMIIGTARSEKHLHVSADRLCRWLRGEYKLRPDADGLLGRKELKLKMKRKNRRAKLLGSGPTGEEVDDGIRTGWVCVNLGMVSNAPCVKKVRTEKRDFVGFGKQMDGTKIVVQMLVEEKREELDLESLWNGIKKRQILSSTTSTEVEVDCPTHQSEDLLNSSSELSGRSISSEHGQISRSPSSAFVQNRGYHSSTRRPSVTMQESISDQTSLSDITSTTHQAGHNDVESYLQRITPFLLSGDYNAAICLIVNDLSVITEYQNEVYKQHIFSHMRTRLENIPVRQAMEEIGQDYTDKSSTSFLRFVYKIMSNFPSVIDWEFQIWLYCFALKLGHSGYPVEGLSVMFNHLQLSGVSISRSLYLSILCSVLRSGKDVPNASDPVLTKNQLELALTVVQDMYSRRGNLLTEDVFIALQESLARFPLLGSDLTKNFTTLSNAAVRTCDLPVLKRSKVQSRLMDLKAALHIRLGSDESRIRLMMIFAKQYDWEGFWEIWRSVAREGQPRSAALYACMFQLVAQTNHQKGCMNVLRTWIPDMDIEEPQVRLEGEVLDAVQACLAVADPSVEIDRIKDPRAEGEWLTLWRRCLEAGS